MKHIIANHGTNTAIRKYIKNTILTVCFNIKSNKKTTEDSTIFTISHTHCIDYISALSEYWAHQMYGQWTADPREPQAITARVQEAKDHKEKEKTTKYV